MKDQAINSSKLRSLNCDHIDKEHSQSQWRGSKDNDGGVPNKAFWKTIISDPCVQGWTCGRAWSARTLIQGGCDDGLLGTTTRLNKDLYKTKFLQEAILGETWLLHYT